MPWEPLQGDPAELGGYRISGRLGAGGMGQVYLAFTPGGRPVALKVLRPELGDDWVFRARFRQEVAAARRVSGLFTAQVLDADPDGSPPWLVTAYVAGQSLAQAVAAHGPLPEGSLLLLAAGVAEALQAIHAAGLVHRDLKPSNVLLATDGPRVIDFGIARAAQAPGLTRTGFRMGSPQFMAPEQVRGDDVTGAADVFALGALTAYAATGRLPFGEGDDAAVMFRVLHNEPDLGGCPGPLLALLTACLAKDPSARPAPAQVVGHCRACAPGGTLEFTGSWLPAAVAADLPRQAPSRTLPQPSPTAAQAPVGPAMPQQPQAPPGYNPTAQFTTAAGGPPGYDPTAQSTATGAAGPPGYGPAAQPAAKAGSGPPRHRGQWPASAIAACVAAGVLVAALAGYGVATLTRSPGDKPASSSSGAPPAANGCLLGTWTLSSLTSPQLQLPGGHVNFGGHGPTATFQADGVTSFNYGAGTTVTVRLNGAIWTVVYSGSFTARYVTRHGALRVSDPSGHGSYTILRDGSYFSSGTLPTPLRAGVTDYLCSAEALEVSTPGGGSDQLVRD